MDGASGPSAWLTASCMAYDAVAFLCSGWLACALLPTLDPGTTGDLGPQALLVIAASAFGLRALRRRGVYGAPFLAHRSRQWMGRTVRYMPGMVAGVLAALPCIALVPSNRGMFPLWPVLWVVFSLLLVGVGHRVLGVVASRAASAGRLSRRVAIVGVNDLSASILARAGSNHPDCVEVIGCFRDGEDDPAEATSRHGGHAVLGGLQDIVEHGRRGRIDAVVLAIPLSQPERITRTTQALASMVTDIYVAADLDGLPFLRTELQHIVATPVVRVRQRPLSPWEAFQKNMFDRTAAAILLVALSPIFAACALLIKMDSAGPVLFRQPRLGFNGAMFPIYKFRTMFHASADLLADRQTTRDDPRITRVGRVLRRLSLDEIPQLLNVLNGSMSLVGPRPHAPNTKAGDTLFHEAVEDYALRHRVKPGITGWAQVNGWRGETRTLEQLQQRVAHDLAYIENWSLTLDLRIIYRTARGEIFGSKAAF